MPFNGGSHARPEALVDLGKGGNSQACSQCKCHRDSFHLIAFPRSSPKPINNPARKIATERLSAFSWSAKFTPGVNQSKILYARMKPISPTASDIRIDIR